MNKKSLRICHLSDIHIRMKERHDEYKEVFGRLCDQLREDKPDRIFLGGDIVHSKISMSPELVHLTRKFFVDLSNIAPVDLIVGNHDMNISNADRMDALTPVVESIEETKNPINYLRDSGFHDVGDGVVYGVFSLIDGKNTRLTKKTKEDGKIYIAAYHGPVAGCMLDNDYEFSEAAMSLRTFSSYDFVFLGDIHKHQFLNKKGTIAYPGSLIQQNFGEGMDKGYLLWDIRSSTDFDVEFRRVPNDYGYYTLYSKDEELPDLDLPSKCRIRVIWEKAAKDISRAETTRVTSMIYKKYNPMSVQLTFKPIGNDNSQVVNVGEQENLADPVVQRDLLTQWLRDKCENDEDIDKILDIDREISEIVTDSTMEEFASSVWSIKNLELENFMSYVDTCKIPFENLKGVIGLFGENATGKSVILDAILYALFNKTSRNVKNEDLVNKHTDNPVCKVVLDLEIRGVDYRIERWTTRQYKKRTSEFVNARTDVVFKRKYQGDDEWENLSETQRNETEKIIRNVVGSFDDFLLTTLSTQNEIDRLEANEFLSLRPALRSDNMLRFLGLDIFNKKYDHAKDILRVVARDIRDADEDSELKLIGDLNKKLGGLTEKLDVEKARAEEIDEEIEALRDQSSKYSGMISEKVKIEKDSETLQKEYDTITAEIDSLNDEVDDITSKLYKLTRKVEQIEVSYIMSDEDLSRHHERVKEADRIKDELKAIAVSITNDKKILAVYRNDMATENKCPVSYDSNHTGCAYLQGYMKKKDECEVLIREVKEKISKQRSLDARLDDLISSYGIVKEQENIRDTLSKAAIKLQEYTQKKTELIGKIEYKELSRNLVSSHLKIAKSNDDTIHKNKKLKEEIIRIDGKIRALSSESKKLNESMIKKHNDIAVIKRDIEHIEQTIEKIRENDEKFNLYNTYCNAMHRTGLPVEVLRSYIPKINYEINKILSDVVSFGLFFKIDQDSTDINIVMRYDGDVDDTRPASMASGMERLLINFAIRYALISVSNLNKPNMWMIDEGFGVLSTQNLPSMSKFFENVRSLFKNIIIITHLDELKDVANWVLNVEKIDGISHIGNPQRSG